MRKIYSFSRILLKVLKRCKSLPMLCTRRTGRNIQDADIEGIGTNLYADSSSNVPPDVRSTCFVSMHQQRPTTWIVG